MSFSLIKHLSEFCGGRERVRENLNTKRKREKRKKKKIIFSHWPFQYPVWSCQVHHCWWLCDARYFENNCHDDEHLIQAWEEQVQLSKRLEQRPVARQSGHLYLLPQSSLLRGRGIQRGEDDWTSLHDAVGSYSERLLSLNIWPFHEAAIQTSVWRFRWHLEHRQDEPVSIDRVVECWWELPNRGTVSQPARYMWHTRDKNKSRDPVTLNKCLSRVY